MKSIIKSVLAVIFLSTSTLFINSASAKTDNDEVDITLIVHCCLGHPFWEPLLKGARDAILSYIEESKDFSLVNGKMIFLQGSPVLKETNGNQTQAANILGINRNTLRKKIAEYGIKCKSKT